MKPDLADLAFEIEPTRMSLRATLRAMDAAHRKEQREEQRRFRDLQRMAKENAKMSAIEQARLDVETFENRLELLLSVHKEQSEVWDWTAIVATFPPVRPQRNAYREFATKREMLLLDFRQAKNAEIWVCTLLK